MQNRGMTLNFKKMLTSVFFLKGRKGNFFTDFIEIGLEDRKANSSIKILEHGKW